MYIFIYYYSPITPDLRKTDTQLRVATLLNLFHIPSEEGYTLYEKSRCLFTALSDQCFSMFLFSVFVKWAAPSENNVFEHAKNMWIHIILRMDKCAVRSGPLLSAYGRRHVFAWRSPVARWWTWPQTQ